MRISWIVLGLLPLACKGTADEAGLRAYVSNEDTGEVAVIDVASDEVIARVAVGKRPRGLRVSPDGRFLYVALSGSPKVPPGRERSEPPPADRTADGIGVVDLGELRLLRVLPAGRDPESFDLSRDGRRLWVSNEETAEASLVDLAAGTIVGRASVGEEPEGVTVHPGGSVVYVTNEDDNSISVVDADSRAAIATIPTAARPRAVAFTADGSRAFVSCEAGGALTVIDARRHVGIGDLVLPGEGVRPMGLTLSPDGRRLYVSGGRGGTVHVIDLASSQVTRAFHHVGTRPWGIALSPDEKKLYTANGPSGDVSVVDPASGRVIRRIPLGGSPWGIAIH